MATTSLVGFSKSRRHRFAGCETRSEARSHVQIPPEMANAKLRNPSRQFRRFRFLEIPT